MTCDHVRENVVGTGNLQPRTSVRSAALGRSGWRPRLEDGRPVRTTVWRPWSPG